MTRRMLRAAAVAAVPFLSACATMPGIPHRIVGVPPQNIVMIDTRGHVVDPTADARCYEGDDWGDELNRQLREVGYPGTAGVRSRPCLGMFWGFATRDVANSEAYLSDVIDHMDAHFRRRELEAAGRARVPPTRRVALIVHGGYNTNRENIEAARTIAVKMLNDPQAPYPILINWQSNLWGSLWDHYFRIRQGEEKSPVHALIAVPYFAADLARGVGRAVATGFYHYDNEFRRNRARYSRWPTRSDLLYCELRREWLACADEERDSCPAVAISMGPMRHRDWEGVKKGLRSFWTNYPPVRVYAHALGWEASAAWTYLPVKVLLAPLLDGLGTPAWDTMIRHVKVGFHNESRAAGETPLDVFALPSTTEPEGGNGGVARFLRALRDEVDATRCGGTGPQETCVEWELTLIGHSMGTIMANEILDEFGGDLEFADIVYMAAACSVAEYERSVLGYMKDHPATRMHHVMLHPFAEIRDQYFMELPPSGSLLVWVDNFLANPATVRDRTAGRFENLVVALPATPAELRNRIDVKMFGVGADLSMTDPQGHADFYAFTGPLTEYEKKKEKKLLHDPGLVFWRPDFWEPETGDRPTLKRRCGEEPMVPRADRRRSASRE